MKRLFSRLPKRILVAVASVAAVVGVTTAVAWYPERPTYTIENPAPHVTFNSITNNPNYGDERTFFDAKNAANTQTGGFVDKVNADGGQELLLRVYVHNNAADNLNTVPDGQGGYKGVARNTKVRIHLPTASAKDLRANAYVSADNAQPQVVSDTVDFTGNGAFNLEYVPGSARAYTNAVPSGMTISDSIVAGGAPIGYEAANGTIPGCFEYTAIVTIKVKVKKPAYSVQKSVRHEGQASKDWTESLTTEAGKNVEWRIEFKNTGSTALKNVKVVDQVPSGLTVVPGSVKLYDSNFPNGYTYPDSAIQSNGRQVNVNTGDYNPEANAFVLFKTKVADAKDLKCGANRMFNVAYATPDNWGTVSDGADVSVNKVCQQEANYVCEALKVAKTGTDREVKITDFKTVANNGATFKRAEINWGDNSTVLKTDSPVAKSHTYAQNGTYKIVATAVFDVNGQEKTATSQACEATVTFEPTPVVTPVTKPDQPTPTELPRTGAASVAGIVAATTVAGAAAHQAVSRRRD